MPGISPIHDLFDRTRHAVATDRRLSDFVGDAFDTDWAMDNSTAPNVPQLRKLLMTDLSQFLLVAQDLQSICRKKVV